MHVYIDDLKFSSSITSDELCSWLKQRSIDEEVVEGFKGILYD